MPAPSAISWSDASLARRLRIRASRSTSWPPTSVACVCSATTFVERPAEVADRVLPAGRRDAVGDGGHGVVAVVRLLRRPDVAARREHGRLRLGEGGREVVDDELERAGVDDLEVVARARTAAARRSPSGRGPGRSRRRRAPPARRPTARPVRRHRSARCRPRRRQCLGPASCATARDDDEPHEEHRQDLDDAEPAAPPTRSPPWRSPPCRRDIARPGAALAARGGRPGSATGSRAIRGRRRRCHPAPDRAPPARRRGSGLSRNAMAGGSRRGIVRAMRLPFDPPVEPMLAKASSGLPDGRRLAVRAQVGRVPGARVPRRRRAVHPEPRPEAARPLLSRARRAAQGEPARAMRPRRRGRDRRRRRAPVRGAPAPHPPGRVAGEDARRGEPGELRRVGPARARATRTSGTCRRASAGRGWSRCSRRCRAAHPPDARDPGPSPRRGLVRPVRGRRPGRRRRQAAGRRVPARQARDAQDQARADRRLRRRRVPVAQERAGHPRRQPAAGPVR